VSFGSFLDEVLGALAAAGVPCMLTGSLAAAVHGAGRATMDIDLIIEPTSDALERFVAAVTTSGRYVSADAAREALVHRAMFKVIDMDTGWKIDLIIRKDRPDSSTMFERSSNWPVPRLTWPTSPHGWRPSTSARHGRISAATRSTPGRTERTVSTACRPCPGIAPRPHSP
jgi:hypothetical protein